MAYNRGRLGDATSEIILSSGGTGGWYSDYTHNISSNNQWLNRGGFYGNTTEAGIFRYGGSNGTNHTGRSTRAALVSLSN